MSGKRGPQQLRRGNVLVPRDVSRRLDRFVARVGRRAALVRLGVSWITIECAIGEGSVMRSTFDRIIEALDREEQAA